MCWEDVEIGQASVPEVVLVVVDNVTATVLADVDPYRSVLIVTCPTADGIRLLPTAVPTGTTGWLVSQDPASQLTVRLESHGRMVQQQWLAIATGAAPVTVMVIKVQLPGLDRRVGASKHGQSNYNPHA